MPKLDGTGPMGQGAGTGRKAGICGAGVAMGQNWCCRCGYGLRRFFRPANDLAVLEEQEKMLENELIAIKEEKAALSTQKK